MPLSLGVWWPLTAVQLSNTVEDFRKIGPIENVFQVYLLTLGSKVHIF